MRILLVFANYKYKGHDIKKLGARAGNYNADLLTIFPCATKEQEEMFELLRDAYIKARYDRNYKITREQLLYLIERVEKLQNLTKRICLEYIDRTS